MGGAEVVIAAFGELGNWLDRVLARWGKRSEKKKSAMESLLKAVRTTQTYIQDQDKYPTKQQQRSKQIELSRLWESAALAFYGVDGDMAPLLQLKSEAWAAPNKWPEAKVEQFGITIDIIAEKARRLLSE